MTNKKPKLQKPAAKNMQTKTLSHNGWAKKKRRKTKHAKNTNERINTSCLMKEKGGGHQKGSGCAFAMRALLMQFVSVARVGRVFIAFRPRFARDFSCINLLHKRGLGKWTEISGQALQFVIVACLFSPSF